MPNSTGSRIQLWNHIASSRSLVTPGWKSSAPSVG